MESLNVPFRKIDHPEMLDASGKIIQEYYTIDPNGTRKERRRGISMSSGSVKSRMTILPGFATRDKDNNIIESRSPIKIKYYRQLIKIPIIAEEDIFAAVTNRFPYHIAKKVLRFAKGTVIRYKYKLIKHAI